MRCYGPRTSSCNPTVAAQEVKSVVLSDIGYFMLELQRAKHTSKAPLVRKIIDNLSSRENLVLASLYERLSSTQTFGASQCHLRFWVFSIIINLRFIYHLRSFPHPFFSSLVCTYLMEEE